jgi:hypothetical protein
MCQQDITAEYEEKDVQMPYSLLSGFFLDFVVFFPSIPRPSRLFSSSGFVCIEAFPAALHHRFLLARSDLSIMHGRACKRPPVWVFCSSH